MKTLDELEAALETPAGSLADLEHANPKRRRDALDRVMRLGRRSAGVARPLLARLAAEDNPFVLSRALSVVGAICPGGDGCAAGAAVARFLAHADPRVIANAVDALRALPDRGHAAAVGGLSRHASARVRANACVYLADQPGFDASGALAALLGARDPATQLSGLWALEQLAALPDAVKRVGQATGARDPEVALRARALVARLAGAGSGPARELLATLPDPDAPGGVTFAQERLDLRVPSLTKRAWAWLADSVVLGALALAGLALARVDSDPRAFRVHTQLVMLGYSIAFFMRDGFGGGRGLFKRYLGLRVVDLELGTGCGYVKSMIRQATFYLPLVNVCEVAWAALDPERCRIVDRLLGTQVVDEKQRHISGLDRALLGLFAAVFALGSAAAVAMAIAGDLGLLKRWIAW